MKLLALFCIALLAGNAFAVVKLKPIVFKRVRNLGVPLLSEPEVNQIVTCLCPTIAKCSGNIADLGTAAVNCIMQQADSIYKAVLAMAIPWEACLIKALSTTAILSTIVSGKILPVITPIYNKMCKKVNTAKSNGKGQDALCDAGISVLRDEVTRKLVQKICIQIRDSTSDNAFKCILTQGKPIIDLNTYECAGKKASILGRR